METKDCVVAVSSDTLQKKYAIPIMLLPDNPLGFMEWLQAHRQSLNLFRYGGKGYLTNYPYKDAGNVHNR